MDMSWQMLVAPLGVAFLILFSWLLGGWRTRRIADLDDAITRFCADYPQAHVSRGWVAADGATALLDIGAGQMGAVLSMGDKLVTRLLKPTTIRHIEPATNGLRLLLDDLAAPEILLHLSAADMAEVQSRLQLLERKT